MLDVLAAHASLATAVKGVRIIEEGGADSDIFIVIEGRLEVQISGKSGPLPVAVLGPDELFGEVAIVSRIPRRTASVVTLTNVTLLRIDGETFSEALEESPYAREELEAAAHHMEVGRFIKSATLLGDLPNAALAQLAERVGERRVHAGEDVVLRGEPGEECFLVRSGQLDVIDDSTGEERRLATLRTGMLFGEAALLTGEPRNATVRAVTEADLLVLRRDDVMAAMSSDHIVTDHFAKLMQARSRPRRRPGIELHERHSADGTPIVTLKDPARGTYFRLSREGAFVWNQLDGKHTLRDLTMDLFLAYKILAPDMVMDIIRHLSTEGFVEVARIGKISTSAPTRWQRLQRSFTAVMEWQYSLEECDPLFTALYENVGRHAFTPAGALIGGLIAIGGFGAFISVAQRSAGTLLHAAAVAQVGLLMIPLIIIAIVMHEFGHGVAAKAAGARVHRVGFGWYWLRIMFFVDTSDAWLATRRQRMLVDAGGILVNLVLAGISGYIALAAANLTVAALAWTFALWSYIGVVRNLNPLLEYDGYYLLMDALERPNLRGRSLGWIATGLPAALRNGLSLRGHRLELWYAFGALMYVVFVFLWTLFTFRYTAQGWVARIAPPEDAPLIGRLFAFALGGLSLFRLCSDIWMERARIKARARHALHKG